MLLITLLTLGAGKALAFEVVPASKYPAKCFSTPEGKICSDVILPGVPQTQVPAHICY